MTDKKLIHHISNLAQLEFKGEELDKFAEQFEKIVRFVEKIDELPTENIEAMISPLDSPVILHEDEPGKTLEQNEALQNAPQKSSGQFAVPKVID